jgi:hypothetical protein
MIMANEDNTVRKVELHDRFAAVGLQPKAEINSESDVGIAHPVLSCYVRQTCYV